MATATTADQVPVPAKPPAATGMPGERVVTTREVMAFFAMVFGDVTGIMKRFHNRALAADGILQPIGRAAGGIDADHAVRPNAHLPQFHGNAAALFNLLQEVGAAFTGVERGTAARRRPDRCDD